MSKIRPQSKAGGLRHRLTVEHKTDALDSWGGPIETWEEYTSLWGEVIYMRGNELWAARQANAEAEGRVRIRYREDITPLMRIRHGNKILQILSIIPYDSRKIELHLLFKEAHHDS